PHEGRPRTARPVPQAGDGVALAVGAGPTWPLLSGTAGKCLTAGKKYKVWQPSLGPPAGTTACKFQPGMVLSIIVRSVGSLARRVLTLSTNASKSGCFPRPAPHTPNPVSRPIPRGPAAEKAAGLLFFLHDCSPEAARGPGGGAGEPG